MRPKLPRIDTIHEIVMSDQEPPQTTVIQNHPRSTKSNANGQPSKIDLLISSPTKSGREFSSPQSPTKELRSDLPRRYESQQNYR